MRSTSAPVPYRPLAYDPLHCAFAWLDRAIRAGLAHPGALEGSAPRATIRGCLAHARDHFGRAASPRATMARMDSWRASCASKKV